MSNYAKVIRFVGVSSTKVRSSAIVLTNEAKIKIGAGIGKAKGSKGVICLF